MKIWFRRLLIISLVNTFLVILAGGVVRTTGSGMGCPDWPKCFGQYIPPTDISELPPNYKEMYAVQGKEIADFNAFHTWTEYVNRLVGATLGLFVLLTLITSFSYRKEDKLLPIVSFLILVMVLFEAWLGSVVVESDLAPVKITTHMLVAFAIVTLMCYALVRERLKYTPQTTVLKVPSKVRNLFLLVIALFILQVLMGTQVREEIDMFVKEGSPRNMWIDMLPGIFFIHRTFSLFWSGLFIYLAMQIFRYYRQNNSIYRPALFAGIIAVLEIISGAIMSYFDVPPAVQPIHLLFSTLIYGFLVLSLINLLLRSKSVKTTP